MYCVCKVGPHPPTLFCVVVGGHKVYFSFSFSQGLSLSWSSLPAAKLFPVRVVAKVPFSTHNIAAGRRLVVTATIDSGWKIETKGRGEVILSIYPPLSRAKTNVK